VHTTNYANTFITVAPDCTATLAVVPKEAATPSAALRTFRMISDRPYHYTSDDVIFTVYADRNEIAKSERKAAREQFFSKGQACLRSSDLGKRYGWGIHSDSEGRVALYGVETKEYKTLASGKGLGRNASAVTVKAAMRSRR